MVDNNTNVVNNNAEQKDEGISYQVLQTDSIRNMSPFDYFFGELFQYFGQPKRSYIEHHSKKSQWKIFDEMFGDIEIDNSFKSLRSTIIRPHSIQGSEKVNPKAIQVAKDCIDEIDNIELAFSKMIKAVPCGLTVTELVYREQHNMMIPDMKDKHPEWFDFDTQGNLMIRRQTQGNVQYGTGDPAPPYKFIVHTYNGKYGDPRGEALLYQLYWYWFTTKHVTQFWLMFTERFSNPSVIAMLPTTVGAKEIDKIKKILKQLKNGAVATFPETAQIKTLEPNSTQGNMLLFKEFLEYCDKKKRLAFGCQTGTADLGRVGSRAAVETLYKVQQDFALYCTLMLESTLNSTLIPWIVDINIGQQDYYPFIQFERPEDFDIELTKLLFDMDFPFPLIDLAKKAGWRLPKDVEEAVLQKSKMIQATAINTGGLNAGL